MKPGRPRRYNPDIPSHIDQAKLPTGAYWNKRDRNWYTIIQWEGKPKRLPLAGDDATLSDLHHAVEQLGRPADTGTIAGLHRLFCESAKWQDLAKATRQDYDGCLKVLERLQTRIGPASTLDIERITKPVAQRLVDTIATDRPAMANHVKRYLSRLVNWGQQRGHLPDRPNPFRGLEAAKEVGDSKMPSREVLARAIAFARDRGQRVPHSPGSLPEYLWIVMLLCYRLRLRGAEALDLSESNHRKEGIYVHRRKGSRENITRWTPELEAAWAAAIVRRNRIWVTKALPKPTKPELRPLIVGQDGYRLHRNALKKAFQRMMMLAIKEGVVAPEDRFSLHGLKHRGITDTKGRRAKQEGAGHRTAAMTNRYDHELLVVDATPGNL